MIELLLALDSSRLIRSAHDLSNGGLAVALAEATFGNGLGAYVQVSDNQSVNVQLFSESNDKLGAHLERIDGALNAQMARSDEQLAYYVAQARVVIDLSILSQKQIIEDLQRLAGRRAAEALA